MTDKELEMRIKDSIREPLFENIKNIPFNIPHNIEYISYFNYLVSKIKRIILERFDFSEIEELNVFFEKNLDYREDPLRFIININIKFAEGLEASKGVKYVLE